MPYIRFMQTFHSCCPVNEPYTMDLMNRSPKTTSLLRLLPETFPFIFPCKWSVYHGLNELLTKDHLTFKTTPEIFHSYFLVNEPHTLGLMNCSPKTTSLLWLLPETFPFTFSCKWTMHQGLNKLLIKDHLSFMTIFYPKTFPFIFTYKWKPFTKE